MRVQAMLGHEAVLRPVLGGGRDASEQVNHVPFGEKREPRLPVSPPWPGRIMGAAPGVVYPFAREADVTDEAGAAVTVTGRCVVSAAPAWLAADGEPPLRITAWAGPWPLSERWWDPAAARRRARFQLLTGDGRAWLAAVQDGRWLIEAAYSLWAGTTRRFPGASCGGGWPGAPRTSAPRRPTDSARGARGGRRGPAAPAETSGAARGRHPVGRAALPLLVQLPRRGGHARRARRRGRPARPGDPRDHRPRRDVRGPAVRAGRGAAARRRDPPAHGVRRRAQPRACRRRRRQACPTRRAATCWSWPVTPKATEGCAR